MSKTWTKVHPLDKIEWVKRDSLKANDYNPNHVAPAELDLLKLSILSDGWTQPIVVRNDGEIVDGFHRWTVSGDPEIAALSDGFVPVVRLDDTTSLADQIASTIRHNRARGVHSIVPMASIVLSLLQDHKIESKQLELMLGMDKEEVERLADTSGMVELGSKPSFNNGWVPV
jgi:ParB-like chromosome segregation protein Spo0J